jgi:hypothetical protein
VRYQGPYRNPMALLALLVSLIPFSVTLAMLAVKFGVGPVKFLALISLLTGPFLLLSLVVGSALLLVAWTRSDGRRDLRIPLSLLLLLLSAAGLILFSAQ